MAVQVDVVHNHYGENSPGKTDLENFDGGEPYFYNASDEASRPGISKTKWGPRPRYIDTNVQAYIRDNIKMYLDEYKVWALRWDSPRNITGYDANPGAEVGDPDTEIPEAVAMMEEIHQEIANTNRPYADRYYSIAEDANTPGGYTGHWEISFHNVIFPRLLPLTSSNTLPAPFAGRLTYPTLNQRNGDNVGYRLETKELPGFRVIFSENHDKCGDHNTSTDGLRLASDFDPANPESITAKKKSMLTAAVTLSSAGTPMLWMGQEQLARDDFKDTVPMNWTRAGQFPGLIRFHRDMIRLRRNLDSQSKALTFTGLPQASNLTDVSQVVFANETNGVIAYDRRTGIPSEHLLVAVNFSAATNTISTNFPSSGPWRVYLNSDSSLYDPGFGNGGPIVGATITTTGSANNGTFVIAPWSVLVFGKSTPISTSADANNNGIDDGWEILYGITSTGGDPDQDGFSNLSEYQRQTDPTVPDRATLAGTFNRWDVDTKNMRWDPVRSVWRWVGPIASAGQLKCKARLQDWVAGDDFAFVPSQKGIYEITYSESGGNYTQTRLSTDSDGDGLTDAWETFWFYPSPANSTSAGSDPDGDGMSNLQEFQRGSDPTAAEYSSLGVVGEFNGWNWNVSNMRYLGHGLWSFFRWLPQGASVSAFKITRGPTNTDPNWGADGNGDGRADFMGPTDFLWSVGTASWQGVVFNEKNQQVWQEGPGSTDVDNDGLPDAWERFYGFDPFLASDGVGDLDGDTVLNLFEYQRGSSPADSSDHYSSLVLPGDTLPFSGESGWNTSDPRVRMQWRTNTALWESLRFIPRAGSLKVRVANFSGGNTDWSVTSGDQILAFSNRGYYVIQFEEFRKIYSVAPMSSLDANSNGIADYWESYHSLINSGMANQDPDGDGLPNLGEYLRGSDPVTRDRSLSMSIVGDLSGWNFTNTPMRWSVTKSRWEYLAAYTGVTNQKFKFVAATNVTSDPWAITNWSLNRNWGTNGVSGNIATIGGGDISYSVATVPSHILFEFDEVWLDYVVRPIFLTDANGDKLPDEWANYHGVGGAANDPDNDLWSNLAEFKRGMNPTNSDVNTTPKRMTVSGSGLVPGWNPNLSNMAWSDDRNQWEWIGTASSTGSFAFKFFRGTNWSDPDWGIDTNGLAGALKLKGADIQAPSVTSGSRYKISFNDLNLTYSFSNYPLSSEWWDTNNLPVNGLWSDDTDGDGNSQLMEYALGGNPNSADSNRLVSSWATNSAGSNRLVLRWSQRTNANVQAEWHTNLSGTGWATSGLVTNTIGSVTNGMQAREASVPIDSTNRKFLRLRVTGP